MGRRILNRKDLRAAYDAAEARGKKEEDEEEEEEEEGDESEEDEDTESAEDEESEDEEGGGDDDDEAPVKKKKKPAPVKEAKPRRSRSAKQVRVKVVWGVFNNSNQRVATFEYKKKAEADEHAAKLKAESKTNQTYFVNPVREPIEEKKS
jgi:hypothetical protein